jgi:monoamine oxidase
MSNGDTDVVVVGGGAAGLAAGRRLHEAAIQCLVVEARPRLGGRALTVTDPLGFALDLGCGWLHSADRNPWSTIAETQGRRIDQTPPHWMRPSLTIGFPLAEQLQFRDAAQAFLPNWARRNVHPTIRLPRCSSRAGGEQSHRRGQHLRHGAELERFQRTILPAMRTPRNWRVVEGYGTTIAAYGSDIPVMLDCPVLRIDHRASRLRIETAKGVVTADQVIVTAPTPILADDGFFTPALPDKVAAAAALPLGLDDKLFLSLDRPEEFEQDSRLFGRTDRTGTGAYHLRPFGRPQIEAYFGGTLASDLEAAGEAAFFNFAVAELVALLGSGFACRIEPVAMHRWGADPFSRGAYSCAACRAKQICERCWLRQLTIACSSPAKHAHATTIQQRMAAG